MTLKAVGPPDEKPHATIRFASGTKRDDEPGHSEPPAQISDSSARRDDRPDQPVAITMPVNVRSAALTVLAVLATILVLQYAQAMVIPIVLGLLISDALEPIVARLTRWRLPRPVAAAIVLLLVTGASARLVYGLRFEVSAIVDHLPDAARRLRRIVETDRPTPAVAIEQVQKAANELERAAIADQLRIEK
ncbi:MAG TPA: AI-2E family transporter [Vicinamibacterales bacterium]|nr:AI-2E family transporter [Vicinamibacterales bacterium]